MTDESKRDTALREELASIIAGDLGKLDGVESEVEHFYEGSSVFVSYRDGGSLRFFRVNVETTKGP